MAYNNVFPVTYPQIYYPAQYQPQTVQPVQTVTQPQAQAQNTGIIWVQGEAGAKSHLVAPNSTVALWDSETQRIFLKSADASGMPAMKILNYTIEEQPKNAIPLQNAFNGTQSDFNAQQVNIAENVENAVKGKFEALQNDLEAMRSEMETIRGDLYGLAGKKVTTKKKEADPDE